MWYVPVLELLSKHEEDGTESRVLYDFDGLINPIRRLPISLAPRHIITYLVIRNDEISKSIDKPLLRELSTSGIGLLS